MTCDVEHFHIKRRITAREGSSEVLNCEWSRSLPRKLL